MAKGQTQTLYSLAAVLGLVEQGNKEDPFHILVYGITGKESVSNLSNDEANAVEAELRRRPRNEQPRKTKHPEPEYPGKMTSKQKSYAWRLLYQLVENSPSAVTVGERMAGVVRKALDEDPCPRDPLAWISFQDGSTLIEYLKRYLRNAKRKAAKEHDSG